MKVMYGEVDAQEADRSRCGQNAGRKVGLDQRRMWPSCTVNRQSWAHGRGGFKGPCARGGMMKPPRLVMFSNHRAGMGSISRTKYNFVICILLRLRKFI